MNPFKLNLYIILTLLGIFIGYCLGITTTSAHAYSTYIPPVIPDYKYQRYNVTPVPLMRYTPIYRPRYNWQEYRPIFQMRNTAAEIHTANVNTYWKINSTTMGYTIKPYY